MSGSHDVASRLTCVHSGSRRRSLVRPRRRLQPGEAVDVGSSAAVSLHLTVPEGPGRCFLGVSGAFCMPGLRRPYG